MVPRPERVALLPSRGVSPPRASSRRRTSSVSALARSTSSPPAASSAPPPPRSRKDAAAAGGPEPVRLTVGEEPGLDGLVEALASAGYERVDRVDERGQFAVRGGIVDIFPRRAASRCASSSSATRSSRCGLLAVHPAGASPVDDAMSIQRSSAVARASTRGGAHAWEDEGPHRERRSRPTSCAGRQASRLRLAAGRRARRVGGGGPRSDRARRRDRARPVPAGPGIPVRSAAACDRRAGPRRGGERARRASSGRAIASS